MTHKYTKNILWHGMEYILRFLLVHLSRFARTCLFVRLLALLIKTLGNSWPTKKQSNTKTKNPFLLPLVTINYWTFFVFCFQQMMWHIIQLGYHCRNIIIGTSYMWIINIPPRRQGILWLLFRSRWDQGMAYIGIIWYIS